MAYWTEVKDIVLKGINMAVDGIKEGAETAAEKGKDGVSFVQLKKDLFLERRNLQDLLADLGEITHDLYKDKKDVYADSSMKNLMDKIVKIEEDCRSRKEKIKNLGGSVDEEPVDPPQE